MKTKRRHELQTNELADRLGHVIERARPYSRAGFAVLVAVFALGFTWVYLTSQSSTRVADGWTEYFNALAGPDRGDKLTDIAVHYAGTPVAEWARLAVADFQLDNGSFQLLVDQKTAREKLRDAAENYRVVILESRDKTVLQHATYGLARAHEALGTPDSLEEARKEYRSIGQKWPKCAYAAAAEARAKDLDELATKNFYDWLARYEPPRPLSNEPGTPGVRPDFLSDPSLEGSVNLPTALEGATSPTASPTITGPALGDTPAVGDTPSPEPDEASTTGGEPTSDAKPDDASPEQTDTEPQPDPPQSDEPQPDEPQSDSPPAAGSGAEGPVLPGVEPSDP